MKRKLARLTSRIRRSTRRIRKARKHNRPGLATKIAKHRKALVAVKRNVQRKLAALAIDWNGCPPLSSEALKDVARLVLRKTDCYITATTNGTHAVGSYHYRRRAIDFGSDGPGDQPEAEAQAALLDHFGATHFRELFGPLGWYVKDGHLIHGRAPDNPNHLHVAI